MGKGKGKEEIDGKGLEKLKVEHIVVSGNSKKILSFASPKLEEELAEAETYNLSFFVPFNLSFSFFLSSPHLFPSFLLLSFSFSPFPSFFFFQFKLKSYKIKQNCFWRITNFIQITRNKWKVFNWNWAFS